MSSSARKIVSRALWNCRFCSRESRRPTSMVISEPAVYRCLSTEAPKNEKETEVRTTEQPQTDQRGTAFDGFRGQMVRVTAWNKRFLWLSGRWKRIDDIPDILPDTQYNSDMWVTRVRVATGFMVFWLFSCFMVAKLGRKHEKEKTHRIVMEQYLESLSENEKKRFMEEFDIKPK